MLRTLLPDPLKQVTSFASLSKPHLPPHDTITALLSCTSPSETASEPKDKKAHGIFELSFAAPAPSRSKAGNTTIITGDKGWLDIATGVKIGDKSVVRVTVHIVTREQEKEGDVLEEKELVIEEEQKSIEMEITNFLNALKGTDDGLGDPRAALLDVAVIQAALNSEGRPVDLEKLVREG